MEIPDPGEQSPPARHEEQPQDTYRYSPEEMAALEERFTIEPVPPSEIADHVDAGEQLVTTDVPGYLKRGIAPDADGATSLYRLVQLFGTPNVPGVEAGADQPERELTTWQYLFRVTYVPAARLDEDDPDTERRLLSVYDYKTDVSVGISEWQAVDGDRERIAVEPSPDPLPSSEMPDEADLEAFVQVVLSSVEHAVEATYQGLHV